MDLKADRNELTGRWSLEGVEPSEVTFERICKMLKEGQNFKFARYGDGEFNCMAGKVGKNCDGHEYFPDLGTVLRRAFYNGPEYMVGIQPLSVQGGLYQKATIHGDGPKNIYDADVLHSASIDGRLPKFMDMIDSKIVFLVGPRHLFQLFRSIQGDIIPDINCWTVFDVVVKHIRQMIDKLNGSNIDIVYLLCASMMSEAIINEFEDDDITMIDCGSVFDPLVGKFSRSYHHKLQLNAN